VTQFELDTAAAFVAFAAARVQVAVVEAGLGGRLDATNVIPSTLTVLTSVGLDHTEWLGDTVEEIAAEKLAVLRDHTTLICGPVPERVEPVIERFVSERHAARLSPVGTHARGPRGYQHANSTLALAATAEILGPEHIDPHAAEQALAAIALPGRAQVVEGDPDVIYDAAHNPDGARALAESLPELTADHPVVACVAVLAEKDAAGICAALAPVCELAICTEFPADAVRGSGRPVGEAIPAAELAELWRAAGGEAEAVADPHTAWGRARELASKRGGVALAAGSHYLLRTLWIERQDQSS
jgi:dihydrofolate synthase/folylpolyglutamate synthase